MVRYKILYRGSDRPVPLFQTRFMYSTHPNRLLHRAPPPGQYQGCMDQWMDRWMDVRRRLYNMYSNFSN